MKSFKQFMKDTCPEYDIQPNSNFAAKLELAYGEMDQIFRTERYKLNYKIKQLEKNFKTLEGLAESWMNDCDKLKTKYEPTVLVCQENNND